MLTYANRKVPLSQNHVIFLTICAIIIAIIIVIFSYLMFIRQLTGPLSGISSTMKNVASGDFTASFDYSKHNEIGSLTNGLNQINNSVSKIINGVHDQTILVNTVNKNVKEEGEKVETTQEKNEEEPKTEEEKEEKQENNMDKDGFENVPKSVKFQLFALFFFLGIFNHLGNILVLTGGRIIAYELKLQKVFTLYTSSSSIFAVCTRMINSRLFIKVSYQKRMVCVCFLMIAGYASMFAVFHLYENQLHEYNVLCFALTFIPSFFLGSCYALGEGAIMAYLRNYPPTLIAGFSSGTGLSGLFSASLNFASQLVSIKYKWFYLVLAPTGFIYLGLFYWSYKLYLKYFFIDQSAADLEKAQDEQKAPLVTDDKEETKGPETDNPDESADMPIAKDANLSKVQDKTMDSMNKKNKELTCENFCKVMGMAGRYIINMGLIYLIQLILLFLLLILF